MLHVTGWYDNTLKNRNVVDPRNWKGHGERSIDDMFIILSKFVFLTDQEFEEVAAEREARRQNQPTNDQN